MGRTAKVVLGLSVGVVLVAGGALALCQYSQTESGSRFLLSETKSFLKKSQHIDLQYRRGKLNPLSAIEFDDLKLTRDDGQYQIEIDVKHLELRYHYSIFENKLQIERLLAQEPSIHVQSKDTAPPPAVPAQKTTAGESDLATRLQEELENIRRFIETPPVKIDLKNLAIENLNVDIDYKNMGDAFRASLRQTSVHLALISEKNKLSVGGDFKTADKNHFSLSIRSKTKDKITEVEGYPHAFAQGKFVIQSLDKKWNYEVSPTDINFGLDELTVRNSRYDGTDRLRVEMKDIDVVSKTNLVAGTSELFEVSAGAARTDAFRKVDATSTFTSGRVVVESGHERFQFDSQSVESTTHLADSLALGFNVEINNISTPTEKRNSNFKFKSDAHLSRDLTNADAEGSGKIDQNPVVHFTLSGNAGAGIGFKGNFETFPFLTRWLAMKNHRELAGAASSLSFDGKLNTNSRNFVDLDRDRLDAATLNVALQSRANSRKGELAIASKVGWEFGKRRADFAGRLSLRGEEAVGFRGQSTFGAKSVDFTSDIEGKTGAYLSLFLPPDKIRKYGAWHFTAKEEFSLRLPETGSLVKNGSVKESGTAAIVQDGDSSFGLSLRAPIAVKHEATLAGGKLSLTAAADAPTVELPRLAKLIGNHVGLSVKANDLNAGRNFDFAINFLQSKIVLNQTKLPLSGVNANLAGTLRDGNRLSIDSLTAAVNRSLVQMSMVATANGQRKEFQTKGNLNVNFPDDFPDIAGHSVRGQLTIPWTLAVENGREIAFDAEVEMKNVGWSHGTVKVTNMTGKIPVTEKLLWDGKHVKFASLITQNPFERVDFERLRPLIRASEESRIAAITVDGKPLGPFVGFFSIGQNLIFAHQFDLNLGRSGVVYGEMYLDVYPSNLQLGILSRLTSLNLVDVLPKKYLTRMPAGDQTLSGRSGLVINLNKGSVDGRIDITQIGGSQLITLINVLDPKYEDDKMNRTRTALGYGYPTLVEMSFQKGYLDMGVDLDVLGVTQRFDVRGIPISPFVTAATADMVKKTEEGPLE